MPAKWRNYFAGVSPTNPAGRKWRKSSPNTFIGFAASTQKGFGTLEFDACAALEAILQREYDLQCLEEAAIEDAVDLAAAQDIKDDDMHVSAAPDMGLCNTTELMDMLDGYYKADLNDIQHEDRSSIHTGMACNDTAFDLDFQGNVAQQALPNIDFGTSTERFDVNDVLEGM